MSTAKGQLQAHQTKTESVPQLLDRAVAEMRDLTSVVNDLEALVGNLVLAGSFGSSHSIYDLQKLDRVRQNIGGIADFLDGISRSSAPEWSIETDKAAASVKLADLSERLRGSAAGSATAKDDAGDFEMFDSSEYSKVA